MLKMAQAVPPTKFDLDAEYFQHLGGVIDGYRDCPNDSGKFYDVDGQYLLMNDWAVRRLLVDNPKEHIDIASQVQPMFFLSNMFPVKFVDIRDPQIINKRLSYIRGDITNLPFQDNSIQSLSSLHVAEHIGLGRYGDKIDPQGFNKACQELKRVLAVGGNLYFAVPVGISKVIFNAHRVLAPQEVIRQFEGLKLIEFSAISSHGLLVHDIPPELMDDDPYGCGLFKFTKEN